MQKVVQVVLKESAVNKLSTYSLEYLTREDSKRLAAEAQDDKMSTCYPGQRKGLLAWMQSLTVVIQTLDWAVLSKSVILCDIFSCHCGYLYGSAIEIFLAGLVVKKLQ